MATVKVTGLSQIQSNIRKFITKELRKAEIRSGVGSIVVESIRAKKFKAPAKSTKKWREKYDSLNTTHPTYNRDTINISFTGELLDDLQKNVRSNSTGGKFEYVIKQSDKLHRRYNGVSGKIGTRTKYSVISDGIINKWKIDYLKFDDKTLTKVVSYINKELQKSFIRFGK